MQSRTASRLSPSRLIALVSILAICGQAVLPLLHEATAHCPGEPSHGHAHDHSHDCPDSRPDSLADSDSSEARIAADCPMCLALSAIRHAAVFATSQPHASLHPHPARDLVTLQDLWVCSAFDLNLAAPRAPPA